MENWIKMRNPGVIQDKGEQKPLPPEVQAQFVKLNQELEQTRAFAQSLHEKLETKQPELDNAIKLKDMDLEFQREKLAVDNTTKMAVEELKQGVTVELETFRQELGILQQQMGLSAEKQAQEGAQQHAEQMSDKAHAQALEQGEQGHAQTLETQEQAAELAPKPEAK